MPAITPWGKSQPDQEHIRKNIALSSMRDEDPREALLKYADKAEKDPMFTGVWRKNQPKTIYAEAEEGEEEGEEESALATPWDTPPPQQSRPLGKVRKGDEITQGDKWFPEVIEISDDESGLGVLGVAPEVESGAEGGEEVMESDARPPCHPNIEEPRTPVRNPSSHTSTPPLTISSTTATTTTPTPAPRTLFSPHTPPNHSSGGGGNINPPSTTARTSISPHTPPGIGCLNIPISTLAVQNGVTKDRSFPFLLFPPPPSPANPTTAFSVPSILLTDSFGNTLFMQRALITESLSSLRSLPIAIPATPLLSALTTQLATHAETLDRFGAWARTISSPGGALNIKMRQESAQHAWKQFLELREELREIRQAREEAVEVVEAWRAFERGDLAGEGDLAREGEEAGEREEGEEGLGGFIEAYVREAGGVEWSADAVETLRVAAEGWTSRWLSCMYSLSPKLVTG